MKKLLFPLFLFAIHIQAQVGINNADPKAALDISPTSAATPASDDGLLVPRLNAFPATNPVADQNAMIIYLNTNLTGVNINGTPKNYSTGFYFWDNSLTDWINMAGEKDWKLTGNSITATDFIGSLNNQPFNIHVNNAKRLSVTATGQLIHHNPTTATLIGNNTTGGTNSVAIGESALAGTSVESVALGNNVTVTGDYAVAIGDNADAQLLGAVAIGRNTVAVQQGVAVGYRAKSFATNSTAIGRDSQSTGTNSTAFGSLANSSGSSSLAAGPNSISSNSNATAVGHQAEATGSSSIALGFDSLANGSQTMALGAGCLAPGSQATGIGFEANAGGSRAITIGYQSTANGTNAVALGNLAQANNSNSTAIGNGAVVSTNNTIRLGNTFVTSVITSGVVTAQSYVATVGPGTGYADYVFENYYNGISEIKNTYNFKSIEETEDFVRQYGHLPGVKSYKEIKANDFKFSVDELSLASLEKIEEQFLYITQLNKALQESKALNKVQDDKIKSLEQRLERLEQLIEK